MKVGSFVLFSGKKNLHFVAEVNIQILPQEVENVSLRGE
jgi:hypothetical protein